MPKGPFEKDALTSYPIWKAPDAGGWLVPVPVRGLLQFVVSATEYIAQSVRLLSVAKMVQQLLQQRLPAEVQGLAVGRGVQGHA